MRVDASVSESPGAEAVIAKSKYCLRCTFCRLSHKKCTYNGIPAAPGQLHVGECDTCRKATTKPAECSGPKLYEEDHLFHYLIATKPRKDRTSAMSLGFQLSDQLQALPRLPGVGELWHAPTESDPAVIMTSMSDTDGVAENFVASLSHLPIQLSAPYHLQNLESAMELHSLRSEESSSMLPRSADLPGRVVQEMWSEESVENDTGQVLQYTKMPIDMQPGISNTMRLNICNPDGANVYDLLLEQVPECNLWMTKEIFSWCIASHKKLTKAELIDILLLKENPSMSPITDQETIQHLEKKVREAAGWLIVFDDNDHVRFIREDFEDYIISGDSRFSISLMKANEAVTLTSIEYLSKGDVRKDLNCNVPYRQSISRYMVQGLPLHYKAAESGPGISSLPGFLLNFMDKRHDAFLRWSVAYDDTSNRRDVADFIMPWKPSLGLMAAQFGLKAIANMLLEIGKHPDSDEGVPTGRFQQYGDQDCLQMDHSFGQLSEQDFLFDAITPEPPTVE